MARRRGLLRLVLLSVMLAVLASYISPVRTYLQRTNQIEEEQKVTQDISGQRDQLVKERDRLKSNEYVEQVARRDLGLIRPGEQPFVVKELGQSPGDVTNGAALPEEASPPEEPSLPSRILDWLSSIFP